MKKKKEKKKLKRRQIVTATDFYIVCHSFFIALRSFFVGSLFFIRLVFAFKDLNLIYGPLGSPLLFVHFHLLLQSSMIFFFV